MIKPYDKVSIKYIGTNKSYTYGNMKFNKQKIVSVDESLAEKLIATGEFAKVGDDKNKSKESI